MASVVVAESSVSVAADWPAVDFVLLTSDLRDAVTALVVFFTEPVVESMAMSAQLTKVSCFP